MKKNFLNLSIVLFSSIPLVLCSTVAQDMNLGIMQKLTDEEALEADSKIEKVWKPWKVNDNINEAANRLPIQIAWATWIMNRNTIMNYSIFIVKFLSQLWLVVWFWFITYAWYKYMLSVFEWGKTPTSTLKNAIIWIIIVIFSYAIMKTLTSIIGLS